MMETAKIAEPISGDKLYQQRARAALPLLVRQATAGEPILYSELADELGMPNPRNLNYPLGSIGRALQLLSAEWGQEIPPIQCVVINKNQGLPGEGVGWFITDKVDFKKLPRREQRRLVNIELQKVYAFGRWLDVLKRFGLEPAKEQYRAAVKKAAKFRGGGESAAHKRLKKFVAKNPDLVGVKSGLPGIIEFALPSGDSIDVLFRERRDWIAVEVKSRLSPEADVTRGIFQCVKYEALLEAFQAAESLPRSARAVLVLEESVPTSLVGLKNKLGVEVRDGVKPA